MLLRVCCLSWWLFVVLLLLLYCCCWRFSYIVVFVRFLFCWVELILVVWCSLLVVWYCCFVGLLLEVHYTLAHSNSSVGIKSTQHKHNKNLKTQNKRKVNFLSRKNLYLYRYDTRDMTSKNHIFTYSVFHETWANYGALKLQIQKRHFYNNNGWCEPTYNLIDLLYQILSEILYYDRNGILQ